MLRQFLGIGVVVLMVTCPIPATAQAKKKPAQAQTPAAQIDADQLPSGEYRGKLLSVPLPNGTFTVEVQYTQTQLKPGALQNIQNQNTQAAQQLQRDLQHIARLEQQIQTSRTPQQAAQHMQQLQQAMAQVQQHQLLAQYRKSNPQQSPLTVVTQKKTIDFHMGDDVLVRTLNLPTSFDDKGQPKKYSAEELRILKGKKTNLPGYEAKLEDLKTGTLVLLVQGPYKLPTTSKKDKESVKEAKELAAASPKTVVSMIVIVGEDSNATQAAKPKPKK